MTNTYPSSKKTKEKVLIAMNGGISSTVAAYLLNKQGYQCIGLALNIFENDDSRYTAKEEQLLWLNPSHYKSQNMDKPLFGNFHIEELEAVKLIANALEIDFFAVNAQSIYFDHVTEQMVSAKLAGISYSPLVHGTTTIFDVLLDKAEKLGCTKIATGHYAKILHNKASGQESLYTSNDMNNDQSSLLSRLTQKHLTKLILPLAEMRKDDVLKISNTLGVKYIEKKEVFTNQSLMHDPRLPAIVEFFSAKSFREEGDLMNYMTDITSGSHEGIHQYYIGQNSIAHKFNLSIKKSLTVIKIIPSMNRVVVANPDIMYFTHMILSDFIAANDYDRSKPQKVFVKFDQFEEKIPAFLKFKNNNYVVIALDKKQDGFVSDGECVSLYNTKGKGGRVIGSGIIDKTGFYDLKNKFRYFPSLNPELDDLKDDESKKSYTTKISDYIHHF